MQVEKHISKGNVTKGNVESYIEGLQHAAIICEKRKRGLVSSDALAIRKEASTAILLARHNHGMDIPLPFSTRKSWKDYLRAATLGEWVGATFIVSLPFILSWVHFLITGKPLQF